MNPQGNASFLGDLLLGILQENTNRIICYYQ